MTRKFLVPIEIVELAAAPSLPATGETYWDTTRNRLRTYDGTNWQDVGQNVFVQETDPGMTAPGLWIELNPDDTVKTFWVENGV